MFCELWRILILQIFEFCSFSCLRSPPPFFLAISFILSYDLEMSLCNLQMKIGLQKFAVLVLLALLSSLQNVFGIRFVIDREECFSHNIEYEGDTLHISFVVIKVDGAWHYTHDGVDLVVSFHVSLLKFFGLLPIKKKIVLWSSSVF